MALPTKKLGSLDVELPVLGFGGVIICADEVRCASARACTLAGAPHAVGEGGCAPHPK